MAADNRAMQTTPVHPHAEEITEIQHRLGHLTGSQVFQALVAMETHFWWRCLGAGLVDGVEYPFGETPKSGTFTLGVPCWWEGTFDAEEAATNMRTRSFDTVLFCTADLLRQFPEYWRFIPVAGC